MSLLVNLLRLRVDASAAVVVYELPYKSSATLNQIREGLGPGEIVTRIGDSIWGYALPQVVARRYGFRQHTLRNDTVMPELLNRVLRCAVVQRLEEMGFCRSGYDRFDEMAPEAVHALGDQGELVALRHWLVRPFSLPDRDGNTYTLLVNPHLAYRFKIDFGDLAEIGFDWRAFGTKARVASGAQRTDGDQWRTGHTALIVKQAGDRQLLCEWPRGDQEVVTLDRCWPLASASNRYQYLRRRYPGSQGQALTQAMRSREDEFYALTNTKQRILDVGRQMGHITLATTCDVSIGGLLELTVVDSDQADALQYELRGSQLGGGPGGEDIGPDDDDDEFTGAIALEF